MNFRKVEAYIQLTRPFNCLITFLSIGAAAVLAGGKADAWLRIGVASLVGALIAAGANAINDFFDVDIDRINKPSRPIPSGAVSANDAQFVWAVASVTGIALNVFLNASAFGIAVFAVAMLYFYSAVFKRAALIGNFIVSLMTAMAFVYGAVVVDRPGQSVVPATFAFLINFAREIVKDVEDMEGDTKGGAKTFPVKYGTTPALSLATLTIAALIAATIAAYALHIYTSLYLVLVLLVDALLVFVVVSMWADRSPPNLSKLSTVLKSTMVIGLVAIFLGS